MIMNQRKKKKISGGDVLGVMLQDNSCGGSLMQNDLFQQEDGGANPTSHRFVYFTNKDDSKFLKYKIKQYPMTPFNPREV